MRANCLLLDARRFIENAVRQKQSNALTLTLTQMKCGLKVSLGEELILHSHFTE